MEKYLIYSLALPKLESLKTPQQFFIHPALPP